MCTRRVSFLFDGQRYEALIPHCAQPEAVQELIQQVQISPPISGEECLVLMFQDSDCKPALTPVRERDEVSWCAEKDLFRIGPKHHRVYAECLGLNEQALASLLTQWRHQKTASGPGIVCLGPDNKAHVIDLRQIDNVQF